MAKAKPMTNQCVEHAQACKAVKAIFGLLVLLIGVYAIAGDMGVLGAKSPVSPWWLLVTVAGLFMLLKALGSGRCPACCRH